jgi:hypothetical protein
MELSQRLPVLAVQIGFGWLLAPGGGPVVRGLDLPDCSQLAGVGDELVV